MFGSFRWFILAVPLITISAASRDQTLDSDARHNLQFRPQQTTRRRIQSFRPRFQEEGAPATPFRTAKYGPRAASP